MTHATLPQLPAWVHRVPCINPRTRLSWTPHVICLSYGPPGQLWLHFSMGGSLLSPKPHCPAWDPLAWPHSVLQQPPQLWKYPSPFVLHPVSLVTEHHSRGLSTPFQVWMDSRLLILCSGFMAGPHMPLFLVRSQEHFFPQNISFQKPWVNNRTRPSHHPLDLLDSAAFWVKQELMLSGWDWAAEQPCLSVTFWVGFILTRPQSPSAVVRNPVHCWDKCLAVQVLLSLW